MGTKTCRHRFIRGLQLMIRWTEQLMRAGKVSSAAGIIQNLTIRREQSPETRVLKVRMRSQWVAEAVAQPMKRAASGTSRRRSFSKYLGIMMRICISLRTDTPPSSPQYRIKTKSFPTKTKDSPETPKCRLRACVTTTNRFRCSCP